MANIVIRAPEIKNIGGWVLDTQFVTTMGIPYLMAHGAGHPVADATAEFTVDKDGEYDLYVYTYNWVAPWKPQYAPGVFEIYVDGMKSGDQFGSSATKWGWEKGGCVKLEKGTHTLSIHDLTGYEGRFGMIVLSDDKDVMLPETAKEVSQLAYASGNFTDPIEAGSYDLVICGGGIPAICAALTAARNGLQVALIQDRPLVGGNNSSEVRVWLGGETNYDPFPGIGNVVNELEQEKVGHYGTDNQPEYYEDEKKMGLLKAEKNITLYMEHIMTDVEMNGNRIVSVTAWDYKNANRKRIQGKLFSDCTGDATLGALAGADFEVTTNGHMGMTTFWYIEDTNEFQPFPSCPWAIDLKGVDIPGRLNRPTNGGRRHDQDLGCWFWETGCEYDPIEKAEFARDLGFRSMYGALDALKNHDHTYETWKIGFYAYICGKRESRRLFGDVVITKSDVHKDSQFDDGCIPSTWQLDVHYPAKRYYPAFHEGDAFITQAYYEKFKRPFFLPYRTIYSRNIANMFMAGRNTSVSHDALGTSRVMRTGGVMGEVIGYASKYCIKYGCDPRGVYTDHLEEFMAELKSIPNLKLNDLVANKGHN